MFFRLSFWLWVAQIALAVLYGFTGFMKSTQPIADLAAMMVWPGDVPAAFVRFVGAAELAGALGLILPSAARIAPWLTPLAAAGLLVLQLLAMLFHISRGEFYVLPMNVVLAGLAAFVLWGRMNAAPVQPRAA